MALFGAIIAVGLGPAMWVGAQFGTAIDVPAQPPAVTSQHGTQAKTQDKGGEAGSAPDTSVIIRTTPEAVTKPLSPVTRRQPGASRTSKPPASPAPSSASPSPSSSDQSSAPADGGQTTPPDSGGTGDGTDQPPSPPADQSPGGGGTGDGQPIAS
jgi:hypothetical protein